MLNLLYYKNLIDNCVCHFFEQYNDCFASRDGKYVLAKCFSKSKLDKLFAEYLKEEILNVAQMYDVTNLQYYFIIGSCMPKDNFLLQFKDGYFPAKLQSIIGSDCQLKYILKEKDILIDIVKFNQVFIDLFNYLFKDKKNVMKLFGKDYKNIIFISHRNLDCYTIFKTIKFLYGKSNCKNLYLDGFKKMKSPVVAVNELIDKYVQNKMQMNKSAKFKEYVNEMHDFIDMKMKDANE